MKEIEENRSELPTGIFEDLSGVMRWLKTASCPLSDEDLTPEELDAELASKLLTLYIDINGGVLIF